MTKYYGFLCDPRIQFCRETTTVSVGGTYISRQTMNRKKRKRRKKIKWITKNYGKGWKK